MGNLGSEAGSGLERSCVAARSERIVTTPSVAGIERLEARFYGNAYGLHRHDTYGLGITLAGVQTFHYRGERRASLPGQVIVLHPDELHDGGAGTDDGLTYRMLYLEPASLLDALGTGAGPLPFVPQPVLSDPMLRDSLASAFSVLDLEDDDLRIAALTAEIAEGLARHADRPVRSAALSVGSPARRQVGLARAFLDAHLDEPVSSRDLETLTGLDRFSLARHFRAMLATSPHRYWLMRRLHHARRLIGAGVTLAEVAAATGFADQSHLTRHFKKAFGLTPGSWASLTRRAGT